MIDPKQSQYGKKSYKKHKADRLRKQREYRVANPVLSRMRNNRRHLELKMETLSRYSKDGMLGCCWDQCDVHDIDMLTLDHVNDDGADHRRELKSKGGASTYRVLERAGYPDGYQTLCWNHQAKKALMKARANRKDGFNEDL